MRKSVCTSIILWRAAASRCFCSSSSLSFRFSRCSFSAYHVTIPYKCVVVRAYKCNATQHCRCLKKNKRIYIPRTFFRRRLCFFRSVVDFRCCAFLACFCRAWASLLSATRGFENKNLAPSTSSSSAVVAECKNCSRAESENSSWNTCDKYAGRLPPVDQTKPQSHCEHSQCDVLDTVECIDQSV